MINNKDGATGALPLEATVYSNSNILHIKYLYKIEPTNFTMCILKLMKKCMKIVQSRTKNWINLGNSRGWNRLYRTFLTVKTINRFIRLK
jgi:hypothetical protein